ncbi:MAG: methionyl-tRNA formyltransferase [Pseudomonadota bacterium]|nr:methionyl-tRNA formyltransferase [Pseudomonadota bacterium]
MYKIVFAGTPEFAVPSLEYLLKSKHDVCAVYTQQDRPKGRGQHLCPSPVKALAQAHGKTVHTPLDFKNDAAISELAAYEADLLIVVAYGMILPESVLKIPKIDSLNVHASLLPKWRGAAPINRAIMAGDKVTGVSIMRLVQKLDAGPVYHTASYDIAENETAAEVYDRLAVVGAKSLLYTINNLITKSSLPQPQADELATYAPKLSKQDGKINFNLSAKDIILKLRGLQPWPGCFFSHKNTNIKVHEAKIGRNSNSSFNNGEVISWDEAGLEIQVSSGSILLTILQLPGKKAARASEIYQGRQNLFKVKENLN